MPWKEVPVMEERLRLIVRLLDGEGMRSVCRASGISRKTATIIGTVINATVWRRFATGPAVRCVTPTNSQIN